MINKNMQMRGCIFILSFLFLLSCDAPRKNPLDPQNPDNIFVMINGTVQTTRVPNQPIKGVNVLWKNSNIFTVTNDVGFYSIKNITSENGWLIFIKNGYSSDSVYIEWQSGKSLTKDFFLNSIPQIEKLDIYSIVVNNYPERKSYEMVVSAKISDLENDIDSVYVENQELNMRFYLDYNVITKIFERRFSIYDLNINSMRELVGHVFEIKVVDRFNVKHTLGSDIVERVILDEIEIINPKGGVIVDFLPTLEWKYFNPGFHFTYTVEIYTDDFVPQLTWLKNEIPADSLSIKTETELWQGEYFWLIWCVDQFENRSSSKPGSFEVR